MSGEKLQRLSLSPAFNGASDSMGTLKVEIGVPLANSVGNLKVVIFYLSGLGQVGVFNGILNVVW